MPSDECFYVDKLRGVLETRHIKKVMCRMAGKIANIEQKDVLLPLAVPLQDEKPFAKTIEKPDNCIILVNADIKEVPLGVYTDFKSRLPGGRQTIYVVFGIGYELRRPRTTLVLFKKHDEPGNKQFFEDFDTFVSVIKTNAGNIPKYVRLQI